MDNPISDSRRRELADRLAYATEISPREMKEWERIVEQQRVQVMLREGTISRQEAERRLGWGETLAEPPRHASGPVVVREMDPSVWTS